MIYCLNIIILVEKYLTVHRLELLGGIDIKNKDSARVQCFIDSADGFLAVSRVCNVVKTVQRTHCQINTPIQPQFLQRLADEKTLTEYRIIFRGIAYYITSYDNIGYRNKLVKIKAVRR